MAKAKHNLQIESRKNKDGKGLLYFNFNYGYYEVDFSTGKKKYKPLKFSTGYRLKEEDLIGGQVSKKYISSNGRAIKTDLDELEESCYSCLKDFEKTNKKLPNPTELKMLVVNDLKGTVEDQSHDSIIRFIEGLIKSNENVSPTSREYLSPKSIVEYNNTKLKLEALERKNGIQLCFSNYSRDQYHASLKGINDLEIDRQLKENEEPTGYTNNYISKISKNILSVLNKAEDFGHEILFNTRGKKVIEVESKCSTYFTEEELELIAKSDVSHSKTLQAAKDFVLISTSTGLRLEDMRHLHQIKIQTFGRESNKFDGIRTLIRKVSKAHSKVTAVIPVTNIVKGIYNDNGGAFPKFQSNISEYIKALCKFLNIDDEVEEKIHYYLQEQPHIKIKPKYEMVNAHKCRNSFVTNLKQLGVSSVLIGEITHPKKDLTNMQSRYDNSSDEDNASLLVQHLRTKGSFIYSI